MSGYVDAMSPTPSTTVATRSVPRLGVIDSARVTAKVMAPLIARGVIKRRPFMVHVAERFDADRRAVQCLQDIRRRHGSGPVMLRLPARRIVVVLEPEDAWDVLSRTPEPFTPASAEKRAALRHFQPDGVLISEGEARRRRRAINEEVLEPDRTVHPTAQRLWMLIEREAREPLERLAGGEPLDWDGFEQMWWRIVRSLVFGDRAQDDQELIDLLDDLRRAGNWAFLRPVRRRVLAEFDRRLGDHLDSAGPESLAGPLRRVATGDDDAPEDQIAHWLFAFDAAAITTFRALAAVTADPISSARARSERSGTENRGESGGGGGGVDELPFHRACILETLRLWPTTPAILREQTTDVEWSNGNTPAKSTVLIHAPFFHRDDERGVERLGAVEGGSDHDRRGTSVHAFRPERWMHVERETMERHAVVPFSAGPAGCPGRNVVLTTTALVLAKLLDAEPQVASPSGLDPDSTRSVLDPFRIEFSLSAEEGVGR
jgi:cytochrome P450